MQVSYSFTSLERLVKLHNQKISNKSNIIKNQCD